MVENTGINVRILHGCEVCGKSTKRLDSMEQDDPFYELVDNGLYEAVTEPDPVEISTYRKIHHRCPACTEKE